MSDDDLTKRVSNNEGKIMALQLWKADHDGWVKADWKGQHIRNKDVEQRLRVVEQGYLRGAVKLAIVCAAAVFAATAGAQLLIAKIAGG